jgi:hypothetical protein
VRTEILLPCPSDRLPQDPYRNHPEDQPLMRVVDEDSHMACLRIHRMASKSPTPPGSAPHISMSSSSALLGIICCWAQFLKILFDDLTN